MKSRRQKALRVAGIFAGIGGFEVGLERAGHESVLLCENDLAAQAVLLTRGPAYDFSGRCGVG